MAKKAKSEKDVKNESDKKDEKNDNAKKNNKNEKENVKESKEKKGLESKQSGGIFKFLKCFFLTSAVTTVLISAGVYQFYACITHVPALPKINLNEYWGSTEGLKDTSIRPYRIVFTDSMQEEIRTLFELYRRNTHVSSLENSAWKYGVNSTDFAEYMTDWIFNYSFRERAKFLNKYSHFKTYIQGLDIHFMHVKPNLQNKDIKVYPLILLHGWPGSIREFYETLPKLTNERAGYDFVFEVIVPSLPGFTYSEAAKRPGMSPVEMAVIMRNLMHRLGHKKYYVQGGDFGHVIGSHMATIFPNEVLGYHTNSPVNMAKYANWLWVLGSIYPSLISEGVEDRMYPLTKKLKFYMEESGYIHLQTTKPDTIGIALQDSPVGLAAYIFDRFMIFTDPRNKKRPRGGLNRHYSMEKLFDNVMLYWATGSITTAIRLYKENWNNLEVQQTLAQIPTQVPTWVMRLKYEPIQHSDFILRFKYPNLLGATNLVGGGHFAAFERPKTFADDLFKAVESFVKFNQ